jgi:hypothetical protein
MLSVGTLTYLHTCIRLATSHKVTTGRAGVIKPEPPQPPESHRLVIRSEELEITSLPAKGADIYSVAGHETGVAGLFKTSWGWRDPRNAPVLREQTR